MLFLTYLISCKLTLNNKHFFNIDNLIKKYSTSIYLDGLNDLWIIESHFDAIYIYNQIKPLLTNHDHFIITEINSSFYGLLPNNKLLLLNY